MIFRKYFFKSTMDSSYDFAMVYGIWFTTQRFILYLLYMLLRLRLAKQPEETLWAMSYGLVVCFHMFSYIIMRK